MSHLELKSCCQACGACCATYRVAFSLHETDEAVAGGVPLDLTEKLDAGSCCMCGTRDAPRRCVALAGTVGHSVRCTIYDQRPSPCRLFAHDADSGHGDISCGDARRRHGLPPLSGSYDAFPLA